MMGYQLCLRMVTVDLFRQGLLAQMERATVTVGLISRSTQVNFIVHLGATPGSYAWHASLL